MCRLKSGIIFKGRSVVAPGENDSHSDLLEELGMEDTQANAMTKFVRAELLPPNDEWWTDPDTWKMHVDQDIVPDWFDIDREKYEPGISRIREGVVGETCAGRSENRGTEQRVLSPEALRSKKALQ